MTAASRHIEALADDTYVMPGRETAESADPCIIGERALMLGHEAVSID